jgi:hypothetical protein
MGDQCYGLKLEVKIAGTWPIPPGERFVIVSGFVNLSFVAAWMNSNLG